MLEGICIHPHCQWTAKDLLVLWLSIHAEGVEYTPEHGMQLANSYPGFVDVSYLMNVWKEMLSND